MDKQGVWSVDTVIDGTAVACEERNCSLVRMIHYKDTNHLGTRYLLLSNVLVDLHSYSENDESIRFAFGRSYSLSSRPIQAAARKIRFGSVSRSIPVLQSNLSDVVRRRQDIEMELRKAITGFLETAPVPSFAKMGDGHRNQKKTPSAFVHVFNVGQGDTILAELPCGVLWLNDAYFWSRKRYDEFKKWMKSRFGVLRLDRLIISHFHMDHIRYGVQVICDFKPKEVVVTDTLIHATAATRNLLREASNRGVLRVLRNIESGQCGNVKT